MMIGMLWACGKDVKQISVAKEYYATKYGRIPDTMEIHPSLLLTLGVDGKSYDGLNIVPKENIIMGCVLLGVEKDIDNSKYITEGK